MEFSINDADTEANSASFPRYYTIVPSTSSSNAFLSQPNISSSEIIQNAFDDASNSRTDQYFDAEYSETCEASNNLLLSDPGSSHFNTTDEFGNVGQSIFIQLQNKDGVCSTSALGGVINNQITIPSNVGFNTTYQLPIVEQQNVVTLPSTVAFEDIFIPTNQITSELSNFLTFMPAAKRTEEKVDVAEQSVLPVVTVAGPEPAKVKETTKVETKPISNVLPAKPKLGSVGDHECDQCDLRFLTKSQLIFHARAHTNVDRFHCHICNKRLGSESNLIRHYVTHTDEKLHICPECGKKYAQRESLVRHLKAHSKKQLEAMTSTKYACKDCTSVFSLEEELEKHMDVHAKPSKYSKLIKTFNDYSESEDSESTERWKAEENSSESNSSPVLFLDYSNFADSSPANADEKPYPCSQCEMEFSSQLLLTQHMAVHNERKLEIKAAAVVEKTVEKPKIGGKKSNECPECKKLFLNETFLNLHINAYHKIKKVQCYMCSDSFSEESELNQHILEVHDSSKDPGVDNSSNETQCKTTDNLTAQFENSSTSQFNIESDEKKHEISAISQTILSHTNSPYGILIPNSEGQNNYINPSNQSKLILLVKTGTSGQKGPFILGNPMGSASLHIDTSVIGQQQSDNSADPQNIINQEEVIESWESRRTDELREVKVALSKSDNIFDDNDNSSVDDAMMQELIRPFKYRDSDKTGNMAKVSKVCEKSKLEIESDHCSSTETSSEREVREEKQESVKKSCLLKEKTAATLEQLARGSKITPAESIWTQHDHNYSSTDTSPIKLEEIDPKPKALGLRKRTKKRSISIQNESDCKDLKVVSNLKKQGCSSSSETSPEKLEQFVKKPGMRKTKIRKILMEDDSSDCDDSKITLNKLSSSKRDLKSQIISNLFSKPLARSNRRSTNTSLEEESSDDLTLTSDQPAVAKSGRIISSEKNQSKASSLRKKMKIDVASIQDDSSEYDEAKTTIQNHNYSVETEQKRFDCGDSKRRPVKQLRRGSKHRSVSIQDESSDCDETNSTKKEPDSRTKGHRCEQCDQAFTDNWKLNRHRKSCKSPHRSQCSKDLPKSTVVKEQITTDNDVGKRLRRPSYKVRENLEIQLVGNKDENSSIMPSQCEKESIETKFPKMSELRVHVTKLPNSQKKHHCPICNESFVDIANLTKHNETNHAPRSKQRARRPSVKVRENLEMQWDESYHICFDCDKRFADRSTLNRHLKIHKDKEKLSCNVCGALFLDDDLLVQHLQEHITGDGAEIDESDVAQNQDGASGDDVGKKSLILECVENEEFMSGKSEVDDDNLVIKTPIGDDTEELTALPKNENNDVGLPEYKPEINVGNSEQEVGELSSSENSLISEIIELQCRALKIRGRRKSKRRSVQASNVGSDKILKCDKFNDPADVPKKENVERVNTTDFNKDSLTPGRDSPKNIITKEETIIPEPMLISIEEEKLPGQQQLVEEPKIVETSELIMPDRQDVSESLERPELLKEDNVLERSDLCSLETIAVEQRGLAVHSIEELSEAEHMIYESEDQSEVTYISPSCENDSNNKEENYEEGTHKEQSKSITMSQNLLITDSETSKDINPEKDLELLPGQLDQSEEACESQSIDNKLGNLVQSEDKVLTQQPKRIGVARRKFPCEICGKEYINKLQLRKHGKSHNIAKGRTRVDSAAASNEVKASNNNKQSNEINFLDDPQIDTTLSTEKSSLPNCTLGNSVCENETVATLDQTLHSTEEIGKRELPNDASHNVERSENEKSQEDSIAVPCQNSKNQSETPDITQQSTRIIIRRRKFPCKSCEAEFINKAQLRKHEKSHISAKRKNSRQSGIANYEIEISSNEQIDSKFDAFNENSSFPENTNFESEAAAVVDQAVASTEEITERDLSNEASQNFECSGNDERSPEKSFVTPHSNITSPSDGLNSDFDSPPLSNHTSDGTDASPKQWTVSKEADVCLNEDQKGVVVLDNIQQSTRLIIRRRKFPCASCGAEFVNKSQLRKHEKSHKTKEKKCKQNKVALNNLETDSHIKPPDNEEIDTMDNELPSECASIENRGKAQDEKSENIECEVNDSPLAELSIKDTSDDLLECIATDSCSLKSMTTANIGSSGNEIFEDSTLKEDSSADASENIENKEGSSVDASANIVCKEDSSADTSNIECKRDSSADASASNECKEDSSADASANIECKEDSSADASANIECKENSSADSSAIIKCKEDSSADASANIECTEDPSADASANIECKEDSSGDASANIECEGDSSADASANIECTEDPSADASANMECKEDLSGDASANIECKEDSSADASANIECKEDSSADASANIECKEDSSADFSKGKHGKLSEKEKTEFPSAAPSGIDSNISNDERILDVGNMESPDGSEAHPPLCDSPSMALANESNMTLINDGPSSDCFEDDKKQVESPENEEPGCVHFLSDEQTRDIERPETDCNLSDVNFATVSSDCPEIQNTEPWLDDQIAGKLATPDNKGIDSEGPTVPSYLLNIVSSPIIPSSTSINLNEEATVNAENDKSGCANYLTADRPFAPKNEPPNYLYNVEPERDEKKIETRSTTKRQVKLDRSRHNVDLRKNENPMSFDEMSNNSSSTYTEESDNKSQIDILAEAKRAQREISYEEFEDFSTWNDRTNDDVRSDFDDREQDDCSLSEFYGNNIGNKSKKPTKIDRNRHNVDRIEIVQSSVEDSINTRDGSQNFNVGSDSKVEETAEKIVENESILNNESDRVESREVNSTAEHNTSDNVSRCLESDENGVELSCSDKFSGLSASSDSPHDKHEQAKNYLGDVNTDEKQGENLLLGDKAESNANDSEEKNSKSESNGEHNTCRKESDNSESASIEDKSTFDEPMTNDKELCENILCPELRLLNEDTGNDGISCNLVEPKIGAEEEVIENCKDGDYTKSTAVELAKTNENNVMREEMLNESDDGNHNKAGVSRSSRKPKSLKIASKYAKKRTRNKIAMQNENLEASNECMSLDLRKSSEGDLKVETTSKRPLIKIKLNESVHFELQDDIMKPGESFCSGDEATVGDSNSADDEISSSDNLHEPKIAQTEGLLSILTEKEDTSTSIKPLKVKLKIPKAVEVSLIDANAGTPKKKEKSKKHKKRKEQCLEKEMSVCETAETTEVEQSINQIEIVGDLKEPLKVKVKIPKMEENSCETDEIGMEGDLTLEAPKKKVKRTKKHKVLQKKEVVCEKIEISQEPLQDQNLIEKPENTEAELRHSQISAESVVDYLSAQCVEKESLSTASYSLRTSKPSKVLVECETLGKTEEDACDRSSLMVSEIEEDSSKTGDISPAEELMFDTPTPANEEKVKKSKETEDEGENTSEVEDQIRIAMESLEESIFADSENPDNGSQSTASCSKSKNAQVEDVSEIFEKVGEGNSTVVKPIKVPEIKEDVSDTAKISFQEEFLSDTPKKKVKKHKPHFSPRKEEASEETGSTENEQQKNENSRKKVENTEVEQRSQIVPGSVGNCSTAENPENKSSSLYNLRKSKIAKVEGECEMLNKNDENTPVFMKPIKIKVTVPKIDEDSIKSEITVEEKLTLGTHTSKKKEKAKKVKKHKEHSSRKGEDAGKETNTDVDQQILTAIESLEESIFTDSENVENTASYNVHAEAFKVEGDFETSNRGEEENSTFIKPTKIRVPKVEEDSCETGEVSAEEPPLKREKRKKIKKQEEQLSPNEEEHEKAEDSEDAQQSQIAVETFDGLVTPAAKKKQKGKKVKNNKEQPPQKGEEFEEPENAGAEQHNQIAVEAIQCLESDLKDTVAPRTKEKDKKVKKLKEQQGKECQETGNTEKEQQQNQHCCKECNKTFSNKSSLTLHMTIHTYGDKFECAECQKHYSNKTEFLRHMNYHSNKTPRNCSICGLLVSDKTSLYRHLKIHRGVKSHSCNVCGKQFMRKDYLWKHMNVHSKEIFSNNENLNDSSTSLEMADENTELFHCNDCGLSFLLESELRLHVETHKNFEFGGHFLNDLSPEKEKETERKRVKCGVCGKQLLTASYMATHMKTHFGGKFECKQCHLTFSFRAMLVDHMLSHQDESAQDDHQFIEESAFEVQIDEEPNSDNLDLACAKEKSSARPKLHQNLGKEDSKSSKTIKECRTSTDIGISEHSDVEGSKELINAEDSVMQEEEAEDADQYAGHFLSDQTGFKDVEYGAHFLNDFPLKIRISSAKITESKISPKSESGHQSNASDNPYKCLECKQDFPRKKYLLKHTILHHGGKIFNCPHCHKKFAREKHLTKHLLIHNNSAHVCNKCGENFPDDFTFSQHMENHNNNIEYACTKCDKTYIHRKSLSKHLKCHNIERHHQCPFCEKKFIRKDHLRQHSKVHEDDRKLFPCDLCGHEFLTENYLTKHKESHKTDERLECSQCDAICRSKSELRRHLQTHVKRKNPTTPKNDCRKKAKLDDSFSDGFGVQYECTDCDQVFSCATELRQHLKSHGTDDKPYRCTECARCFRQKYMLNKHLNRIHNIRISNTATDGNSNAQTMETDLSNDHNNSSEENTRKSPMLNIDDLDTVGTEFNCHQCRSSFPNALELRDHLTTHDVEKVHVCNQCGKRFRRKGVLIKHLKIHTDCMPFCCSFCPINFAQKDQLEKHVKTHLKGDSLFCEECGKTFTTKEGHFRHLRIHSGLFECPVCRKSMSSKTKLNSHMSIHVKPQS